MNVKIGEREKIRSKKNADAAFTNVVLAWAQIDQKDPLRRSAYKIWERMSHEVVKADWNHFLFAKQILILLVSINT